MIGVRYGLPALLTAAGLVLIVVGHGRTFAAGTGVVLLGSALMVWLVNWLFRLSIQSNAEREREEQAREYYARHGRWPGEK